MSFLSLFLKEKKNPFQNIKVHYLVRKTSRYGLRFYVFSFITANFCAVIFGKNGYISFYNLISLLGSYYSTPFPFIFNISCIITGVLLIPFFVYYVKNLRENLEEILKKYQISNFFKIFLLSAFYSGIVGCVGFIGTGLVSMDWNPFFLHEFFAFLFGLGFVFVTFFMSWLIYLYELNIPNKIGIFGILTSSFLLTITIFFHFFPFIGTAFFEWLWMILLIVWLWFFLDSFQGKLMKID